MQKQPFLCEKNRPSTYAFDFRDVTNNILTDSTDFNLFQLGYCSRSRQKGRETTAKWLGSRFGVRQHAKSGICNKIIQCRHGCSGGQQLQSGAGERYYWSYIVDVSMCLNNFETLKRA